MRITVLVACVITVAVLALPARGGTFHSYPSPPAKLKNLVYRTWNSAEDRQMAICLAWHESKYDKSRRVRGSSWSATSDHGLWQINYSAHHRSGESEYAFHKRFSNWGNQARFAFKLSHGGSTWTPWVAHQVGLC